MFGQRPVAGLAVHMCVLAVALHIQDIGMARLAGLMTGELHRSRSNFTDSGATVVPILAKAWWNHEVSNNKKDDKGENEQSRESEKMPGILECTHCSPIS